MACTTCAPSPIALPTRLTDPDRTSPTANTPGIEDFERRGRAILAFAEVHTGDHEAGLVHRDPAALKPFCRGIGADEEKDVANGSLCLDTCEVIPPTDPLESRGVSLAIALRLAPATPIFGSSSKGRGG